MTNENQIMAFKYFVEEYLFGLNGGGTFTITELITEFKKYEDKNSIDCLRKDANYLKEILTKEDWEIKKNLLDYLLKKGSRNYMKSIVNYLVQLL
ncbi:hypothetical protein CLHUN_15060 [Ruminiclostridium hungatei]|uniref:Uncharacterized protein n=1 Tax=Ruminiclostridium hungatei TaxID=48256 RepID=A0A1V4SL46_RUMHU|nr:hypothetical protein [Ruminiclostridium hungatei]OPX44513.1 hypothetical protein CLHUN_15060 [Ruminiclostridium hungatei]